MVNFLTNPVQTVDSKTAKAVGINDLPAEAWSMIKGMYGGQVGSLYQSVAWLHRAIELRAEAVSSLPFVIESKDAGTQLDTSKEYKNTIKVLHNPQRLLYLIEASLVCEGAAYLEITRGKRFKVPKELAYLNPLSVMPVYKLDGSLDYFNRTTAEGVLVFSPKDLVYIWAADPYREIGPGSSPARAALVAANVLENVGLYVTTFLSRGAIKPTILTVEGNDTDPGEKRKLLAWWKRVAAGVKGAFASHVVSGRVKPETIGEGLENLTDQNLTKEMKEDVATALGVPHSLLFSDAANYATAQQDDLHFYDKTIVPEAEMIAAALNEQWLLPMGYRLRFTPENLDVYQADETERSGAYKSYIDAGMRPSIAAGILGIELPKGVTPETLDADWEKKQNQAVEIEQMRQQALKDQAAAAGQADQKPGQQKPGQDDEEEDQQPADKALQDELDKWQRKLLKAVKAGKDPAQVDFESEIIPPVMRAAILGSIEGADAEAVKAIFSSCLVWENYG